MSVTFSRDPSSIPLTVPTLVFMHHPVTPNSLAFFWVCYWYIKLLKFLLKTLDKKAYLSEIDTWWKLLKFIIKIVSF